MPLSSFSWRAIVCAVAPFVGCVGLQAVPVISQQPQSASVTAGQTASFSVTATGAGPLTYQWRRDGISIVNATNSFFVLGATSQGDRGVYDVVVNDGQQSVESSRATLRVGPTQQPGTISLDLVRSPVLEGPSDGQINQIAALPDGRFYVRGTFSAVDGQARARVARFNADGSLDRSFVPAAMDGAVGRIAAYPDGRLIVTGTFRNVGGVSSGRLVRLRADGARDPEFAVGAGFEGAEELFIHGIALATDGAVFLGVDAYQSYQGSRGSVLIKIRNDGTKDPQFALPSSVGIPLVGAVPELAAGQGDAVALHIVAAY